MLSNLTHLLPASRRTLLNAIRRPILPLLVTDEAATWICQNTGQLPLWDYWHD